MPWRSLPPTQQLTLSQLKLKINVFTPSNKQQNSNTNNIVDNPTILNTIQLAKPQNYYITPCQYNPQNLLINTLGNYSGFLTPSAQAKAYFIPTANLDIRNLLIFDNDAKGYQYVPTDNTFSPKLYTEEFFTRTLANGQTICGPQLAKTNNNQIIKTNIIVSNNIETKTLPNGDWLIKDGPRVFTNFFDAGQCGACPRVQLAIYAINHQTNNITPIFNYLNVVDLLNNDIDIHITPDWKRITIYEGKVNAENEITLWRTKTYCFNPATDRYKFCQQNSPALEPSPRFIQPSKTS